MTEKLPKRFRRLKLSIPANKRPDVLFFGLEDEFNSAIAAWNSDGFQYYDIVFESIWFEVSNPNAALLIHCISEEEFEVWYYYPNNDKATKYRFSIYDGGGITDMDQGKIYEGAIACLVAVSNLSKLSFDVVRKFPARGDAPPVMVKGDGYTYSSLKEFSKAHKVEHQEPLKQAVLISANVRVRNHPVRGHWRTLKSGRLVWVRAHRRGDASLGVITRVVG